MLRPLQTFLLLLPAIGLFACGSGGAGGGDVGGTDGAAPAAIESVAPLEIASDVQTILTVTGRGLPADGSATLEVGPRGAFALEVQDPTAARATIPAGALEPGVHALRLVARGRVRDVPGLSLRVDDRAGVRTVAPTEADALTNVPLTLEGAAFPDPAWLVFRDARGVRLGAPMPATVDRRGSRLRALTPILPEVRGTLGARVEVQDASGGALPATAPLVFRARVSDVRAIDGSGNHEAEPDVGRAGTALREDVAHAYDDGVSAPTGARRPGARAISNVVCDQDGDLPNAQGASDVLWLWGQFLDHDIDLTPGAVPAESFPIPVPQGDSSFDPAGTGTVVLPFTRSAWDPDTGTGPSDPRRQVNAITSWIDASNVYGSDATRARALRALDGTGRLRTSAGDLLPFNTDGLDNAPTPFDPSFFLAGDVRANEQVGLTALHTLFVREHNRVADAIRASNPHLDGDQVYEAARRWVGAELQVITFREYLPLLLGRDALGAYAGYDPALDASIGNLFSTAAYRYGHSMVSGEVLRLDARGDVIPAGNLSLADAFFHPALLVEEGGIEPLFRGFANRRAQALDPLVVDELRNFLFGPPGAGGLDLAALNLQRGRDHGLPGYNACRVALGLPARRSFDEVTRRREIAARLEAAYPDVDDADVWVVGLAEDPVPGAMVGELIHRVLRDQFRRLRDGDRFWYERVYGEEARRELEATRLSDVIRRNTSIGAELQDDVFRVPASDAPSGTAVPPRPPRRGAAELERVMRLR